MHKMNSGIIIGRAMSDSDPTYIHPPPQTMHVPDNHTRMRVHERNGLVRRVDIGVGHGILSLSGARTMGIYWKLLIL
jgi:hypothetical protein